MSIVYADSWVAICNLAIARIGKPAISSLTEGTPTAGFCNTYLGEVIDKVASLYDWAALTRRAELARLATAPAFGFTYAYQLPEDFVRPRLDGVILDESPPMSMEAYTIEGGTLLTDAEAVQLIYIARPDDPAKLARHIYTLLAAALALRLTTPLIASEGIIQRLASEYNDAVVLARRNDASLGLPWSLERERGYAEYGDLR